MSKGIGKNSIKVLRLDISETCIKPPATSGGGMGDTIRTWVEGLGGLKPGIYEGQAVWRIEQKIKCDTLDIDEMWANATAMSCGRLIDVI